VNNIYLITTYLHCTVLILNIASDHCLHSKHLDCVPHLASSGALNSIAQCRLRFQFPRLATSSLYMHTLATARRQHPLTLTMLLPAQAMHLRRLTHLHLSMRARGAWARARAKRRKSSSQDGQACWVRIIVSLLSWLCYRSSIGPGIPAC
jgi:hypothetical protein